jgi:hypothetical protein
MSLTIKGREGSTLRNAFWFVSQLTLEEFHFFLVSEEEKIMNIH